MGNRSSKLRALPFLRFEAAGRSASGKTAEWSVMGRGEALGLVRWYGPWRCYVFAPYRQTLYERLCLREIADFCEHQTEAHRENKRRERERGGREGT